MGLLSGLKDSLMKTTPVHMVWGPCFMSQNEELLSRSGSSSGGHNPFLYYMDALHVNAGEG